VGVLCVGLAGYELSQISAAERAIDRSKKSGPEYAALEHDGREAQTLFWVFGGAGSLALTGALVLALVNGDDPARD
jgi:hypothetical protein